MWLKSKRIDALLADAKLTRREFADDLDCPLRLIDKVFDGYAEAGEELSRLLLAAFGAADMQSVIDWRRSA